MFTAEPSYSTKTLRRPPGPEQFFHVNIENEWDHIAEAVVGSTVQPSTELNQLILLLKSHGVVIHTLPAHRPHAESPSVLVSTDDIRSPFATARSLDDQAEALPECADFKESFFPRDVALVHGAQLIEAPPPSHAKFSDSEGDNFNVQNINVLFQRLERAGAEVTRWRPDSDFIGGRDKIPEEKLSDVRGSGDREEEGPRFCPSDILILSPSLLVTRLSYYTNNQGLEYLWSTLSRPSTDATPVRDNGRDAGGFRPFSRTHSPRPARTTTLLVRITDPDSPTTSASAIPSPRLPIFGADNSKNAVTGYIPLCRALVPINKSVMLYDPGLIAEDEARRLKSVLDRVQEDSRGPEENSASDSGGFFTRNHAKRDSEMSYGTFGSLDRTDDDGWQFISIDGLHSTSILMVSPQLALLSLASSTSISNSSESAIKYPRQRVLTNVSQVLESLGVRPVRLPSRDLNYWQPNGGVRDAVLVLRRESNLETSDHENDESNRDRQQQDEEGTGEGCMGGICASLSAWLCESSTGNGGSEADASDRL